MDLNQDIDTSDPGRAIGNGVVVGYGIAAAATTALVFGGFLPGFVGLVTVAAIFLTLFSGDMYLQTQDIGLVRRGLEGDFAGDSDADSTDAETETQTEASG